MRNIIKHIKMFIINVRISVAQNNYDYQRINILSRKLIKVSREQ